MTSFLLGGRQEFLCRVRRQEDLLREGIDEKGEYRGGKWGGIYLRAPDIYFTILEKGRNKLVRLGDIAKVYGYIHDNNTGDKYPRGYFLKSIKNANFVKLDRTSPGVTLYGVKKEGKSRLIAPLLFARTFGDRLFILWNIEDVLAKEFYKVIPNVDYKVLAAITNTIPFLMQIELLGLANLGGGAIKLSIQDIKQFYLPADELVQAASRQRLLSAFDRLASRLIRSIFEELGFPLCKSKNCSYPEHPYENVQPSALTLEQVRQASPDRFELDSLVFDVLGLTEAERLEVYRATAQLVKNRLLKAKSV